MERNNLCPRYWREKDDHLPDCILGLREDIDYLYKLVNEILEGKMDAKTLMAAAFDEPKEADSGNRDYYGRS